MANMIPMPVSPVCRASRALPAPIACAVSTAVAFPIASPNM